MGCCMITSQFRVGSSIKIHTCASIFGMFISNIKYNIDLGVFCIYTIVNISVIAFCQNTFFTQQNLQLGKLCPNFPSMKS